VQRVLQTPGFFPIFPLTKTTKGAKGFTGRRGANVSEEGVNAHEARALGRGRDAGDEHAHARSFSGTGLARADEVFPATARGPISSASATRFEVRRDQVGEDGPARFRRVAWRFEENSKK
jgi:hypothetical protein